MRRIEIRVPDDIGDRIDYEAECRAKSAPEYVRDAAIAYMTKYPAKGPVVQIVAARRTDPKNLGSDVNIPRVSGYTE